MKNSKFFVLLLTIIMAFTILTGCSQNETSSKISFKDMADRQITLEQPATKIVAITSADCEILYAIGAGDNLVGKGEYCDYPSDVKDVKIVQSGSETNIEQIIALKPQVVLMSKMDQTDAQITKLENAGIKVVVSDAQNIDGVYTAIEMIGKLSGKNDNASALIKEMKDSFSKITADSTKSDKTVYFEVSPLEYGLWSAGSNTFMDEIATMLGLKNAFSDVKGWGEISQEQVIQRNPDYIITITMYNGQGTEPEKEIMSRAGWSNINAVKNGNVFNADSNELSRPGPRLVEGAKSLYTFIYK